MNKIAAYNLVLADHPFWTKEARVFGARRPNVSETLMPMDYRTDRVREYAEAKAAEPRTPMSTAVLTGGGLGAIGPGLGALAMGGRRRDVVSSALAGAIGGGLAGGLMSAADAAEIRRMNALNQSGDYERAAVEMGVDQLGRRRALDDLNQERRHQELMSGIDRIPGRY